jgi:putative oxidoreductase
MRPDHPGTVPQSLSLLFRVVLGAMFLYAGIEKALDPAAFAVAIGNYHILPPWMINPSAIILPWVEIFAGLSLAAGILLPGGALVISCLLLIFVCALGAALLRGLDISCGCFSSSPGHDTITWWYLLRDVSLFIMSLITFLLSGQDRISGDHLFRRFLAGKTK